MQRCKCKCLCSATRACRISQLHEGATVPPALRASDRKQQRQQADCVGTQTEGVPPLSSARAQAEIWSERCLQQLSLPARRLQPSQFCLAGSARFLQKFVVFRMKRKKAAPAGWCQLLPLEPQTRRWESDSTCV